MASIRLAPQMENAVTARTVFGGASLTTANTRLILSRNQIYRATVSKLKATRADELQRPLNKEPGGDESKSNNSLSSILPNIYVPEISSEVIQKNMEIALLIQAYRAHGHLKAKLDPLGLEQRQVPDELDPSFYGFTEADLDRTFCCGQTLESILTQLERMYCGTIGYEYMHILDSEKCNWLRDRIETQTSNDYDCEAILEKLMWSSQFEELIAEKIPEARKYRIDGCEALIPGVEEIVQRSAELGVESIVAAATHRRFNLLCNLFEKPFHEMFSELRNGGMYPVDDEDGNYYNGSGDLMITLGHSCDRKTRSGKNIHLSLLSTPTHIEAGTPVAVGKTRAKQYYSNDSERTKVMGIVFHGDAGFVGQGVVSETLQLSGLEHYTIGGTIHIIVNNQLCVSIESNAARSSRNCTDFAKAMEAPVFHVNADDVEAVVHVCRLAVEWRQKFHSDVVVNVIGFRKIGHTEYYDPTFTLPKLYQVINNHPSTVDIYKMKLWETGKLTSDAIDKINNKVNSTLDHEYEASLDYKPQKRDSLSASWSGFKPPTQFSPIRNTGVKLQVLKKIGKEITRIPENFNAHKVVKEMFGDRARAIETGEGIDWGLGEALAFATLLNEGYHVRLSGLDSQLGTFLHRHSIIHDQQTGEQYCPVRQVIRDKKPEMLTLCNSALSEYATMGFEAGYAMENPNSLVIWEAQLGDFSNLGQVIIDQFLSSGEAKWLRQTGLVLFLPHGHEGYGAEHSNARLERFLQMSNDDPYIIPDMDPARRMQIQQCNLQVVNVSTPANIFHVLRRQVYRDFRKPLVVVTPKELSKEKHVMSNLNEFDDIHGLEFKRLIEDKNGHLGLEEGIKRLILCSGKVYYELDKFREKVGRKDVAICRVEQLCPFPYDLVGRELKRYPNAEIVWCQEEHMNVGAYHYIAPRLFTLMKALGRGNTDDIKYVGRPPSAAAATGFLQFHLKEQADVLEKALQPHPINYPC